MLQGAGEGGCRCIRGDAVDELVKLALRRSKSWLCFRHFAGAVAVEEQIRVVPTLVVASRLEVVGCVG